MNNSSRLTDASCIATLLIWLSMVAGCVTSAETTLSDAALAGDPDAMWTQGQDLARNGERLIKRGETRMLEARRQIRDGEAMIRTGSEQVLRCRVDYENVVNGAEGIPASSTDKARQLKAIGKRWEAALDAIREGNLLVEKGNTNIETGRGEVRDGRVMIETGSILMRNAERSRRGDALLPMINRLESTSEK